MKKIYLLWVLCAYIFAGCGGGATKSEEHNHDHEAHEHEEGHNHEHEGHDHEHEGDEYEGHEHGNEAAAGVHSNEIIFKEELAKAVGLQTKVMEPAPFTDVIKTSGSVMAAQGDETTVVATVPGIVTFGSLSFVDGTPVRKGQAILSLASSNLSEGNVAARVKYAYENAKKEYERMQQLVGDKIVSAKDF